MLYLDFHSPGACENEGVYVFLPSQSQEDKNYQSLKYCVELINKFLGDYAAINFKKVASYPSRFKTEQHTSFSKFYNKENSIALTFEIPYNRIGNRILLIDDYLEIGRRIANATCNFLKNSKKHNKEE